MLLLARSGGCCYASTMGEIWVKTPCGRYEVSCLGRVRSLYKGGLRKVPRVLSPKRDRCGYLVVNLVDESARVRSRSVHRVVLEAFSGECGKGRIVRHLNGVRDDNRVDNLRWGTHAENSADRARHGTHGVRLSEEDARAILSSTEAFRGECIPSTENPKR